MKIIFLMSFLIIAVNAFPQKTARDAQVLNYKNDNSGLGGYNFAYDTSDGISRQESGQLQTVPGVSMDGKESGPAEALVVRGSYNWVAADGQQYTVNYVADENGFHPEGAHIPR